MKMWIARDKDGGGYGYTKVSRFAKENGSFQPALRIVKNYIVPFSPK